jgi:polyisoprenoid-binding protein YceI
MALAPGTYQIGPDTGSLMLRTSREGMAAKVGHDLLIEMTRWAGTITITDDEPATTRVEVDVEMASFEIRSGTGGVAALSDGDRKDITATALKLMDVDGYPHATYVSTAVTASAGGGAIEGTLALRGQSAPVTVQVAETGPNAWTGTASLQQSAFGIKPYRAFFGALRLADRIDIEIAVGLSGSSDNAASTA